jgi:hypothetical protein
VIALVAIYQRSESAILLLGTLAGFIQLLDAGVGLLQHDLGKSIGPLVIAAFQLLAVCASYVDLSEAAWNSGRARKQSVASMFRFRKCI